VSYTTRYPTGRSKPPEVRAQPRVLVDVFVNLGGDPAPLPHLGLVLYASPDRTVSLTGTSATGTGAINTPTVTLNPTLASTAAVGTGATNTVTPSVAFEISLTGTSVAGTGAINTPTVTLNPTLASTAAVGTGSTGTLTPSGETIVALAGTSATGTGAINTPTVTINPTLVGTAAVGTGSAGSVSVGTGINQGGDPAPIPHLGLVLYYAVPAVSVSATGQIGSLGKTFDRALTGVVGTGGTGTITGSIVVTVALTGSVGTGAAGELGKTFSKAITGAAGAASLGVAGVVTTGGASGAPATLPHLSLLLAGGADVSVALLGLSAITDPGYGRGQWGTGTYSLSGGVGTVAQEQSGGSDAGPLPHIATLLRSSANIQLAVTGVEGTAQAGSLGLEAILGIYFGSRRRPMGLSPGVGPFNLRKFYKTARYNIGATYTSDVQELSGVEGTTEVNTPTVSFDRVLSGASVSGLLGTVVPIEGVTIALEGVAGTGEVGSFGTEAIQGNPTISSRRRLQMPGVTPVNVSKFRRTKLGQAEAIVPNGIVRLVGVSATGNIGSLGVSMSAGITGVEAIGQYSYVYTDQGITTPIAGVVATGSIGVVSVSVECSITGVPASGGSGVLVPIEGDVVVLAGTEAFGTAGILADKSFTKFMEGVQAFVDAGTVTPYVSGVWMPVDESQGAPWTPAAPPSTLWTPVDQTEAEDWTQ